MQRRKSSAANVTVTDPQANWESLFKSLEALDETLPAEYPGITNPEALLLAIEQNPMTWSGYFQSTDAKALIPITAIENPAIQEYISQRNHKLEMLFQIRQAAFKADNETLLNMGPEIAKKRAENGKLDTLASQAIEKQKKEITKQKKDKNNRTTAEIATIDKQIEQLNKQIKTAKVHFKRREAGLFWNKGDDTTQTYGELISAIKKAQNAKKYDLAHIYETRCENFHNGIAGNGQEYQAYARNIAKKEDEKESLRAKQTKYESELDTSLDELRAEEAKKKQARNLEVQDLQDSIQPRQQNIVKNNYLVLSVNLLLLSIFQDWLMTGGALTVDRWAQLETLLRENLEAFDAGTFVFGDKKAAGKLPPHMLHHPVYMKLFDTYRRDPNNFRENIQKLLLDFNGSLISVDYTEEINQKTEKNKKSHEKSLRTTYPLSLDSNENTPENTKNAIAKFNVEGYVEPLSTLFKQSTVARLFMMIEQISPEYNLPSNKFLEEAAFLRACANKAIAGQAPSASVDYAKMLLVALQDPKALESILLKTSDNPFYNILVRQNLVNAGDFSFMHTEEFLEVKFSIQQLLRNPTNITPESINSRYVLIKFFKRQVGLRAEANSLTGPKGSGGVASGGSNAIENEIIADLNTRKGSSKETKIDVILLQVFTNYTSAMYYEFLRKGGDQFTLDKSAFTHDMYAKHSCALTAEKEKERRKASVSYTSSSSENANRNSISSPSSAFEAIPPASDVVSAAEPIKAPAASVATKPLPPAGPAPTAGSIVNNSSGFGAHAEKAQPVTASSAESKLFGQLNDSDTNSSEVVTAVVSKSNNENAASKNSMNSVTTEPPKAPPPPSQPPKPDDSDANANSKSGSLKEIQSGAGVNSQNPTPVSTPTQRAGSILSSHDKPNTDGTLSPNASAASVATKPLPPAGPPPTAAAPEPEKTSTEKRVGVPSFLSGLGATKLKALSGTALEEQQQKQQQRDSKLGVVVDNIGASSKDASNSSSSTPAAPSQSTVPTSGAFNLTDAIAKKQAEMAARKGSTTSGDTAIQQIRRASDAGAPPPKPVTPPAETVAPVDEVSAKDESGSEKPKASTPTNPSSADKGFNEALLVQAQVTAKFKNARGDSESDSDSDSDADSEDWNHSTTVPQQAREPKLGKPSITGTFGSSGKRNQTANSGSKPKLGN